MRNSLIIFSALAIMLLGLYGSAVIVFDENRLKSLLASQVETDTGRRIEIRGDLKIHLFPGLRLEAGQVVVFGPEGYRGPPLLEAELLEMQVRLLPLIRGELDARELRLSQAAINLHSDPDGLSSLAGLIEPGPGNGALPQGWLSGPVSVDEVLINLSDSLGARQDSFSVDHIELDGFAMGEPLAFRFVGNLGDPPLFDELEIDGLLLPTGEGLFRLSNMRAVGTMEGGYFDFELLGNLSITPGPPLQIALDSGRLRIDEHEFEAQLSYGGFDRPYFNAELRAEFMDLHVARLPELLLEHVFGPDSSRVLRSLAGMDFDLLVEVDQVAKLGLVLGDLRIRSQSRERQVVLDELRATLPGGYLTGLGAVDLRTEPPRTELGLRIDADALGQLASAIPARWLPGGSGALSLVVQAEPSNEGTQIEGSGAVELWHGSWPLLAGLLPIDQSAPAAGSDFQFLNAGLSFDGQTLALSGLQLVTEEAVAQGDLALDWSSRALSGLIGITREDVYVELGLSGSLDTPELTAMPRLDP